MDSWPNEKIASVALQYIRKHCMNEAEWQYTRLGSLHQELSCLAEFGAEELPVVSCFVHPACWYVLTSRRTFGINSTPFEVSPLDVERWDWGDFKHRGRSELEEVCIVLKDGNTITAIYEAGPASMAPIYYDRFWHFKYPVLDKLVVQPRKTDRR